MFIKIGKRLSEIHDKLRINKDRKFIPLIKILPKWLLPNQVTIFRTIILLIWLPFAIFKPSIIQVVIFLIIYFLDLLDGAMARLENHITYFGGYLDHLSDKFSNIAMLIVLYGVTEYQFKFFLFFIWWDIVMAVMLAIECYLRKDSRRKKISYIKTPFEFIVKFILWVFLIFKIIPILSF